MWICRVVTAFLQQTKRYLSLTCYGPRVPRYSCFCLVVRDEVDMFC